MRAAATLLLLAASSLGCTKPAPKKPEPPAPVIRLLAESVERRAQLEALVAKAGEWMENAAKLDKLLELEGANRRTPPEPLDPAPMEAQLRDAAARAKLSVVSLQLAPPPAQRAFPEAAPADARFDLAFDDVYGAFKATLAVTPDDPKKLEAMRILLRAGDRLWRVVASRVEGKARVLELKTFGQRKIDMPRYVQNEDLLPNALAAAKAPSIDELLAGPHASLAKDLQAEFDRIAAARARLAPELPALAAQHLRESRYAMWRKLLREWEAEAPLVKAP